ncbi:hypothetical protein M378DRAFT_873621 [Amanita muscaria Koide BX008]|uniref:Uncharacterized protein n=1 Tax=Amanita muscaria (strain Koide BX008) TaxID=946122 RepID=A0A0C2SD91_AMAMK|nr:hypothetical protein M378DRAFT_873621 [Amanita muscaria Koide BX008]
MMRCWTKLLLFHRLESKSYFTPLLRIAISMNPVSECCTGRLQRRYSKSLPKSCRCSLISTSSPYHCINTPYRQRRKAQCSITFDLASCSVAMIYYISTINVPDYINVVGK